MTHHYEALSFRHAFGVPTPAPDTWHFQLALITEEFCEFSEAAFTSDPSHTLKELADLTFVCYQYAAAQGWNLDAALTSIFESNMSKLGEDGKPIRRSDGKILKGPNYKEPNLYHLVDRQ